MATEKKYPIVARAALVETAERMMQLAANPGWDDAMREEFHARVDYLRNEAEKYSE